MNEKTRTQIENMKKQTIGVEVEMNSITRQKAAKLTAEFFGTGRYEDTAYRNGYYTWSAWDADGREWKFQRDVSIDGPDSEKCEMVTPILTYADMETLQELIRRLRKAGAKSDATRGCGVHIHIGANGHTPQSLRNLANIMASHESLLADALALDRYRMSQYCRTVDPRFLAELNRRKPSTMSDLANVWYDSHGASGGRNQHYNNSRYHMLNLHATFTKGTVEFRLFQFDAPANGKQNGLHAGQLKSYIQLPLIIEGILTGLLEAIPQLIEAGVQLFMSLVAALPDIIAGLVSVLPELITSLLSALMEFLPQIIDAGIQLFTSLVQNLPEIINGILQVLPEIISSLITALISNVPQIIDAGVQLLTSLVGNLPNIINTITGVMPQIISGITSTLSSNIPKIIEAGVKLLTSLISNLPSIIASIVKAIPQIITGIVDTLATGIPRIVEIGGNLVKGLWDGIQQLAGWLWDKVSGWISGIWDGICDFFGIHSPSREMAWVGEMLVKGLSGAIDDSGNQAVSAAEKMADGVLGAFDGLATDINSAVPSDFDFTMNTNSAVSAAKHMAEDINAMMGGLSADMTANLPSKLDLSTPANVAGNISAKAQQMPSNGPLFTVQQMIVRSEEDIRRVSQNLYDMIQTSSRAQGHFVLT